MTRFPSPKVGNFFDHRLIVSWNIMQPPHLPSLKNLLIQISGVPPLNFEPLQDPKLEIPELNSNDIIVNWVIQKPSVRTKVTLSIQSGNISEEHSLIIDPERYTEME